MNRTIFSFLITFLAGLSTMFGIIPIYMSKKKANQVIASSLAFSSGVMISISVFSLIPEATFLIREKFCLFPTFLFVMIFVVLGILFSLKIDQKVEEKVVNNNLYKLGIISIIVLILHNIPEGITTFISTKTNLSLGLSLSIGIALHNIPEGISIAVPIYYSTKKKWKAIFYTMVSGFSELFGAILAYLFIARFVNDFVLGIILSTTAGIMLHISLYELLPNSSKYNKKSLIFVSFMIGVFVMIICENLF